MVAEVRANRHSLTAPVADADFRKLAENIPTLCWMADAEGYIFWYNRRWYDYTGTTPEQMAGWGWQSVHDPKKLAEVLERWQASITSAQPFEMVFPIRGADGVFRPFLTRITPAFDESGALTNWFGVNTDISPQVEAEAAFVKSEARFRVLADAMPQMVWSATADGAVDYFNARWYEFTGLPIGAADGNNWSVVVHPGDLEQVLAAWRRCLATGEAYHGEFRVRHHSGTYRWWLGRGQPDRDSDGRIVRWYGTCTDIEDIVQARQVLKRSRDELEAEVIARTGERNLLATLVEITDVLIMAIDSAYTIIAINKANAEEFAHIYGVRPLVGDNLMELLAGQPDQPISRATWGRALAGEEMTIVASRGDPARERPSYEIRLGTLRDADGTPIGAFQFAQDVTARLRDAAMLAHAQEALLQSQKLEAMGQLTGGVAHDFNNLLTPIIATLDLLQRRGIGGERERRLLHGAIQSAERAKTLVHRLLAFARRQPLQAVSIDVGALIRGLSDLLASTMGPQVALDIEIAGDLPAAKADPGQLEMAIVNLCLNARDAMDGAGTIRIAATLEQPASDDGSGLAPGAYVRVAVADTGMGMDEATRARAIEPFFSTKGIGKGTGLGLSMAHGLASQLGGALTIRSEVGAGTEVAMWLPESAEPAQSVSAAEAAEAAAARAGIAMVVEDEEYIRVSIVDMLTDLGFAVREAASAEAALEAIEAGFRPDILITDHLMPGMTGVDLARVVRARDPGMKVLIISGFAETDGIDPSFTRLTKPFLQRDLLRHIRGEADLA